MSDELHDCPGAEDKPVLVGPQPFSLEEILRHVYPAPDGQTECFVAAIYADRHSALDTSLE
jgi:hypothetical protein